MTTALTILLGIAVLLVPVGCAYLIVRRILRRQQEATPGDRARKGCAACDSGAPEKVRSIFDDERRNA